MLQSIINYIRDFSLAISSGGLIFIYIIFYIYSYNSIQNEILDKIKNHIFISSTISEFKNNFIFKKYKKNKIYILYKNIQITLKIRNVYNQLDDYNFKIKEIVHFNKSKDILMFKSDKYIKGILLLNKDNFILEGKIAFFPDFFNISNMYNLIKNINKYI